MLDMASDIYYLVSVPIYSTAILVLLVLTMLLPILVFAFASSCSSAFFVYFFELRAATVDPKDKSGAANFKGNNKLFFVLMENLPQLFL